MPFLFFKIKLLYNFVLVSINRELTVYTAKGISHTYTYTLSLLDLELY